MQAQHRSGLVGEYQDQDLQNYAYDVAYNIGSGVTDANILGWLNAILPAGTQKMQDVYNKMGKPNALAECDVYNGNSHATCMKNARVAAVQWGMQQYKMWVMNKNLCPSCAQRGVECGTVPPDGKCPSPTNCGACGGSLSCVNGKCITPTKMPHLKKAGDYAKQENTGESAKFSFKMKDPIFPDQPLLQILLEAMYDQLALIADIPAASKTYNTIAAWMTSKTWKNIQNAYSWAELNQDVIALATICKTTPEQCAGAGTTLFNKLLDKCVSAYNQDYINGNVQKDESTPPPAEEKSNIFGWMFGISAVLLAGGAAFLYYEDKKKPAARNPAKMSGYKNLKAAIKHAYRIAVVKDLDQFVMARSDGFYIDEAFPDLEGNDEYYRVMPEGEVSKWVRGRVGWNMMHRTSIKRMLGR